METHCWFSLLVLALPMVLAPDPLHQMTETVVMATFPLEVTSAAILSQTAKEASSSTCANTCTRMCTSAVGSSPRVATSAFAYTVATIGLVEVVVGLEVNEEL